MFTCTPIEQALQLGSSKYRPPLILGKQITGGGGGGGGGGGVHWLHESTNSYILGVGDYYKLTIWLDYAVISTPIS